MLAYYQPGLLEQQIEELYQQYDILTPRDLRLENIQRIFHIKILYNPIASFVVWDDECCIMNLKEGLSEFTYKRHFFHELYHQLEHQGNQMYLPHFLEVQMEEDAKQFESFAMMPFFMLIKRSKEELANPFSLATLFDVPVSFVEARLRRIYERAQAIYLDYQQHIQERELLCCV
ncbi:hypothetical protein AM501_20535 [Aneurinibacillus migulanus]|uniref:ImmA/IrrE family metallo-endopeptidase n=1 Tax=Aneurinibacillus migulanus TaxID=47500 RepID=UPI0005BD2ACE|nr:ImmA/IrrE family metallo-endopeptidase [Aneurinibacillus migulanus]KIV56063.1 hypothetical protein TS64_11315 [Aneurinibacillus migulanus]KPD06587.1 hypothetical protein AM501_20535 [Aneurinibacillus migulanus]